MKKAERKSVRALERQSVPGRASVPASPNPFKPDDSTLNTQPSTSSSAFSLVELIGVLAIVAILGAAAVPVVIRQMDQAARTKELADLSAISNAIVLQVLNTKTITNAGGLAQSVATWTRYPVSQVTNNNRRFSRAFLVDKSGWFNGALPFTQTVTGVVSAPVNARIMVVGAIAANLPVATGSPTSTTFNDIWNTPVNSKPSTWSAWTGKGEDLFIQRIDLGQLFHRLVLINRDGSAAAAPRFAVDTTNTLAVAAGGAGTGGYYLDGSVVSVCDATATPMLRFSLTKDTSYVFEGGFWHPQISGGAPNEVMAQDFANLAARFLATQWYPGSHQGGDQQGSLVAMFNYMLVFGLWANQCPHFNQHNAASAAQVPEYELLFDVGGNSRRLDEFTGTSGLLK
jgi:type II secretory pathway pseudopilin PulG